ncbi:thrombospondin type-1 domain-containing protein 4-like [Marmota monax]|uniref:Thrombospondin type-1 domain-containing protein 4-like n=1 Tax=Marmota monax TaxID=9995 RepID=A0A834Q747_MARMO|nr:thrombospondin type-1 domain-containing protein 4-like [Marmota monax]
MVSHFKGSLGVLGSLLLLGLQLVCPQHSTDHRKVPQRVATAQGVLEDSGGAPGVWGAWGPWSACSRSCSGGVMEQTRPCLPSSYRTRGGPRPGAPARTYTGHVVSAVRTSVPLHRSGEELRAQAVPDAGRQVSAVLPVLRGSRHPQARGRQPTTERRSRNRGPIGPGKYGYGKAPYILPLQTDTTHTTSQRLRRQRPSPRHSRSQGTSAPRHGYSSPAHQLPHHAPLYQSDNGPRSRLQTSEDSIYQLPLTHDQGFPAASSLFQSPETSNNHGMGAHGASQSFSQPLRSTAISCIGAYRQYKLCNTDIYAANSRLLSLCTTRHPEC